MTFETSRTRKKYHSWPSLEIATTNTHCNDKNLNFPRENEQVVDIYPGAAAVADLLKD